MIRLPHVIPSTVPLEYLYRINIEPYEKIEEGKGEASQMSEVSYTAPQRKELREELYCRVDYHKQRRAYRDDSHHIDVGIGIVHSKSEEHSIHSTRGAKEYDIVRTRKHEDEKRKQSCTNAAYKVEQEEFVRPHPPLHLNTKEEQGEHIEKDM